MSEAKPGKEGTRSNFPENTQKTQNPNQTNERVDLKKKLITSTTKVDHLRIERGKSLQRRLPHNIKELLKSSSIHLAAMNI